LPQSREEFETRALLLQLLKDLQTFVQLKVDFANHYPELVNE
ncbi:aromatic acid exporter family protein, partial [Streptococcus danieliae]|nr:aromatic acid exporter family protein [Streptococcus danieliae]